LAISKAKLASAKRLEEAAIEEKRLKDNAEQAKQAQISKDKLAQATQ